MAMAHSSARVAEPKEAMKPSPIVFTSEPPWAFRASRMMRSCSRSTSRAFASPRRWVRAVEPSTSVKRTVRKAPAAGRPARCGGLLVFAQELVDGRQHRLHVAYPRRRLTPPPGAPGGRPGFRRQDLSRPPRREPAGSGDAGVSRWATSLAKARPRHQTPEARCRWRVPLLPSRIPAGKQRSGLLPQPSDHPNTACATASVNSSQSMFSSASKCLGTAPRPRKGAP